MESQPMEPQVVPQPTFLQKYKLTIVLVVVVLVLGAAFCYMLKERLMPEGDQTREYAETSDAIDAVSASIIIEGSIYSNPVEDKLPDLNPVDKTNPYASYKNPFE
jgi:hypothetical protein